MATDLKLSCSCGAVKGTAHDISRGHTNRVICGCRHCQALAHYLGRAETMLDGYGGTDLFQMSPKRFEIAQGLDHITAVRLTPKGAVRWHTDCCRTPFTNTPPTNKIPFMAVFRDCIDPSHSREMIDQLLGPVRARVNTPSPAPRTGKVPLYTMIAGFSVKLLGWKLRGDQKQSPFFDTETGAPLVEPRVLSKEELDAIMPR